MATTRLPADFLDFLRLLNSKCVEYLLVAGYEVCYHGYYRNTNDIDFWIAVNPDNARRLVELIGEFGFDLPELTEELFLKKGRMVRMGAEPTRIEILTEISGCEFADCYPRRARAVLDGVEVNVISREDLIRLVLLPDAQKPLTRL